MSNDQTPRAASDSAQQSVEENDPVELMGHLAHIAEMLPGAIYALRRTPAGVYSFPYASAALEELFGFAHGELGVDPSLVFTRVHEDDLAPLTASIEASAASLSVWNFQFRIQHARRGTRWILGKSTPERDRDGNVTWFGFAADVTDTIHVEHELEVRKRMLEAVITNSPSVLSIKDLHGRYVLANPNMQARLRRSEAEIIGTTTFDYFDDATARMVSESDARVLATNQRVSVEERVVIDGKELFYSSFKFPIPDESGAPAHICSISLDITERRLAERELAERELLFRNVFNQQFQFMAVLAPDGRVREISDLALRVAQSTRDEYVGQYFWLVPGWRSLPEWHGIWQDRLRLAAAQEGPVLTEDTFLLPDGSFGYADAATTAVRDATGHLQFFIVQASDTTPQKRAELALRASEASHRTLLDSMVDGVFVAHHDAITFANPALTAMLGYTGEELTSTFLTALVAPECHALWQDAQHRISQAGVAPISASLDFLHKDGTRRISAELRARSVRYLNRPGVLGIVRDIGARLRAEAALRESESRFRQLAESIREVFWLTDVAKGQILYLSPAYESIWGRSVASVFASPASWMEAIHPDDRERIEKGARELQASGTYNEEYRIVRPDGSVRWIRDQAYPVHDESGAVTRVAGVAEDITERRTLEDSLRQTQKMESIGQLAGGVAHDFNNSLTVIMGCARLLENEHAHSPDASALLLEIQSAAERAASLTKQLLAFSRQEVLAPRVLDLNEAIGDTQKMLDRLLGEDVMILPRLDRAIPNVKVDPGHIVQVLMNLAVNARDAMPQGGTLEIATSLVSHDAEYAKRHAGSAEGEFVQLRVTDVGMGMSPEVLSRIFEPFFTTKSAGRGTGLGLSVVHGIVTQNGGTIDVESREGVGTTFRIAFPAVFEPVGSGERTAPRRGARGVERILLVEDDESVRRIAARALRDANYHVLLAADGVEALQLLADDAVGIDAIITDVVMPRMGGSELAEGVRAIFPNARILFTSGYTNDALSRNGIVEADVSFLQKPYAVDDLLAATRRLLDRA